jgi:hypothetical protein
VEIAFLLTQALRAESRSSYVVINKLTTLLAIKYCMIYIDASKNDITLRLLIKTLTLTIDTKIQKKIVTLIVKSSLKCVSS